MLRLLLFLTVFCTIYGLLNFYVFLKVKTGLAPGTVQSAMLLVFMAVMVVSPILTRTASRLGFGSTASLLAYLGYTWMGFLFLVAFSCFILDLYHMVMHLISSIASRDLSSLVLPARQSFLVILVLCAVAGTYAFFEALAVRTDHLVIKTSKIPKELGKVRIVQISDVHLGIIVQENRLKRIIDRVKEADPDILVSTGDLLDGQLADVSTLAAMFRQIHPRYGKFAVTGNHEFYVGLEHSLKFMNEAGFTILRGEWVSVGGAVTLIGVDDAAFARGNAGYPISEKEILSQVPGAGFRILLKHRPEVHPDSIGRFDLQLSGHTHGSQLLPFKVISKLFYPYNTGLIRLGRASILYVTRGSGTWGPPMRLLVPPEVTVIDLVHQN
ncbi:MAG: metallophosphoesterase [Deltaproteobacteria bacterium]|nr:metallophosphoesterase [Deltaproteobacteria bacterium]